MFWEKKYYVRFSISVVLIRLSVSFWVDIHDGVDLSSCIILIVYEKYAYRLRNCASWALNILNHCILSNSTLITIYKAV